MLRARIPVQSPSLPASDEDKGAYRQHLKVFRKGDESNYTQHKEQAPKSLVNATLTSDIVVTTPVAFAQMVNHITKFNPPLTIVDEAGRVTEASP